jgi:hypothetical protein
LDIDRRLKFKLTPLGGCKHTDPLPFALSFVS